MRGSIDPKVPWWKVDNLRSMFPSSTIVTHTLTRTKAKHKWTVSRPQPLSSLYTEFPTVNPSVLGSKVRLSLLLSV